MPTDSIFIEKLLSGYTFVKLKLKQILVYFNSVPKCTEKAGCPHKELPAINIRL